MLMTKSQSSGFIFAKVLSRVIPALCTIISKPPCAAAAVLICSPASAAVMSIASVEPPISAATRSKSACCCGTSRQITCAPSRANTCAIASPIPRLAPVTTAVLPANGFAQSTSTVAALDTRIT